MKVTHVRRKVMLSALAGAVMIPGSAIRVKAAEGKNESSSLLPVAGIESVLTECLETNVKDNINLYLIPTNEGEYLNRAFSNVKDFSYIRNAPNEESEWTGKLYDDSTVTVLRYEDDWTKIRSGNVEGYVPADALYTGDEAKEHAKEYETDVVTVLADVLNVRSGQGTENDILTQVMFRQQYEVTGDPENGWYPVKVEGFDGWVCGDYVEAETTFSYAESREEEEHRLARGEEVRQIRANGGRNTESTGNQSGVTASAQPGRTRSNRTNGSRTASMSSEVQANGSAGSQTRSSTGSQTNGTAAARTGSPAGSQAETAAARTGNTVGSQANGTAAARTGNTAGSQANGTAGDRIDNTAGNQTNTTTGVQTGNTTGTQSVADSVADTQSVNSTVADLRTETGVAAEVQSGISATAGTQSGISATAGTQSETSATAGTQPGHNTAADSQSGNNTAADNTVASHLENTTETQSQISENAELQTNSTVDSQTQFHNGDAAQQQADSTAEVQEAAAVQTQEYAGQAVIDFACQFIGNPYVWGGTSLTDGADCSGFVQSVYANFGIALPRTTWDMENVGYEVSYDQALPGDLVLYDGHVGLYMGDGTIVNAMNEAQGIGICTASYAPIISIRRVL